MASKPTISDGARRAFHDGLGRELNEAAANAATSFRMCAACPFWTQTVPVAPGATAIGECSMNDAAWLLDGITKATETCPRFPARRGEETPDA